MASDKAHLKLQEEGILDGIKLDSSGHPMLHQRTSQGVVDDPVEWLEEVVGDHHSHDQIEQCAEDPRA
jgi:hypothetical protein